MSEETVKRPRGRPRKNPLVEREPEREPMRSYKMRVAPNWDSIDPLADDSPDRLRVNPDLIPDGLALMWVTDSVYGQHDAGHRMKFEKGGWTPIHQDDFDGQFNGIWMPKDAPGEINYGGLVLMCRPEELQRRAKMRERKLANEPISIKERDLLGGNLPDVSLDPQHPSARRFNHITKTMERIEIPED